MRPIGGWNSFAVERKESRKEVCQHILRDEECFQVSSMVGCCGPWLLRSICTYI